MNQLSVEDVQQLGRVVGLEIDDVRANTIASRAVWDPWPELEEIPEDLLMSVEFLGSRILQHEED